MIRFGAETGRSPRWWEMASRLCVPCAFRSLCLEPTSCNGSTLHNHENGSEVQKEAVREAIFCKFIIRDIGMGCQSWLGGVHTIQLKEDCQIPVRRVDAAYKARIWQSLASEQRVLQAAGIWRSLASAQRGYPLGCALVVWPLLWYNLNRVESHEGSHRANRGGIAWRLAILNLGTVI